MTRRQPGHIDEFSLAPYQVLVLEKENTRLLKLLREAESTAAELSEELDSAKRTADSATSMARAPAPPLSPAHVHSRFSL